MKYLIFIACALAGAVVIFKFWSSSAYPGVDLRYRYTLEAEVDGKPVSGSGVIEVSYARQPRISPEAGSLTEGIRGEAVALDLGAHGTLFAILKAGRDPSYGPESIVLYASNRVPLKDAADVIALRGLQGTADIPLDKLWMLVRFRDIGNPKSVEAVDPNDLTKSFGPGVKLLRATIEITDDPVTTGIEKKLGWLQNLGDRTLGGTYLQPVKTFSDRLGILDFRRGME